MSVDTVDTSHGLTLARGGENLAGDWLVWFGRSTRHFWAISLSDPRCLIEVDNVADLMRRFWLHMQTQP